MVRLMAVFAGGSLGQRTVATLGLATIAYGIYRSAIWVILIIAGVFLCFFAAQDYDRTHKP